VARSSPESSVDYDGAWKEALELYLEPFLRLCFPIVHAGIDWNHLPIPLDKELQEIVRDAQTGRRHVDKLFRVVRRDGVEEWLQIHIEVQSQPDPRLSERMCTGIITGLAIATTDPSSAWRFWRIKRPGFDPVFTRSRRGVAGSGSSIRPASYWIWATSSWKGRITRRRVTAQVVVVG
jgi:hypothetical protein